MNSGGTTMEAPASATENTTPNIGKRALQYVQLRDMIAAKKQQQKEELKPLEDALDKLNDILLGYLNSTNQNSASTDGGTVYRTAKASATLADGDAFMRHVIGTESWELLDRKANKTAVREFIEKNHLPPPGVNYRVEYEVGVRRSK
jgi:hypothetical protein